MTFPELKECPTSGTGVHAWVFYASCRCVDMDIPDDVAEPFIIERMTRAPNPESEVRDALEAAGRQDRPTSQRWPGRNFKLIQDIFKTSKPDWRPLDVSAIDAVTTLFPGDPLICIGKTSYSFTTRRLQAALPLLARYSLIVPSPMTAIVGKTKAGHLSMHSLGNTGDRHYIITEWDWGTQENHLRMIQHLRQFGKLACVVHSGGKSSHAWWDARGEPEDKTKEFFSYAATLGADPRLWLRSQFVRIPAGRREDGRPQPVLFLETNL